MIAYLDKVPPLKKIYLNQAFTPFDTVGRNIDYDIQYIWH